MALTERQLNRALLARQLLLDRGEVSLPEALEQIGGIQAQYAPAMYVGLWSRVEGLGAPTSRARSRSGPSSRRRSCARRSISFAPRDYWPLAVAVRDARRDSWLRNVDVSARQMAAAARTVAARLADGPATRRELEELVGKERARGVGLWHDMVRVPPSGTWERRRADLYGDAADWLAPEPIEPAEAIAHLVRSYLRGFGPATRHDVASFTGLKLTALKPALAEMEDSAAGCWTSRARRGRTRTRRRRCASCRSGTRRCSSTHAAPACSPRTSVPACSASRGPTRTPTFLVDGAVAGEWRYEDGRVALDPWTKLDRATRRALDDEAERLAAFHA